MPALKPDAELIRVWSEYLRDPCRFVKAFWPDKKLTRYQRDILESVRDNPETWVPSGNELGKSFTAAVCALWWFLTRRSKVVITSSSEDQIRGGIWGEIDRLLRTASVDGKHFDFGGIVQTDLELRYLDDSGKPIATYSLRCKVTNEIESSQGRHEPKLEDGTGTVLFIVEEGSHLEEAFYDSFSSQAHSLLVVGNPLVTQGVFYDKCRAGNQRHPDGSGRLFRKVIHVSGEDSPNVKVTKQWKSQGETSEPPCPIVFKENRLFDPAVCSDGRLVDWKVPGILSYEQYIERLANWTPDKIRSRLFGQFPDEAGQKLFPPEWLDIACELGRKLREHNAKRDSKKRYGRPYGLGIDVSQGGGDLTVWIVFGRYGVRHLLAKATPNTAEIAGQTLRLMKEFNVSNSAVVFDAGGGGKQIADGLRDRGYEDIQDVDFGSSANQPDEYRNRRCELYGELRKAMEPKAIVRRMHSVDPAEWRGSRWKCVALPPDDGDLRRDLGVLPLLRDAEGRLRLPPKDSGRTRTTGRREQTVRELLGGRSPDRGDALVLAYFAWRNIQEDRELERIEGPLVW